MEGESEEKRVHTSSSISVVGLITIGHKVNVTQVQYGRHNRKDTVDNVLAHAKEAEAVLVKALLCEFRFARENEYQCTNVLGNR